MATERLRKAYFDCQFGAAGDMLLAALLAAGLAEDRWLKELSKIALPEGSFTVSISDVTRCSIAAKKVDVRCAPQQEERHLSEILDIIARSPIPDRARDLSERVFRRLAEAEAAVHGVSTEEVHFHEVGAVDAIVDVVGFAIAYDMLSIDTSHVSPLPLGTGTVMTEHGLFPVPGPAVVNLVKQAAAPVTDLDTGFECLTPTGAAILTTIAARWGAPPAMDKIFATGYGAGTKDNERWPNVTRVILGEGKGQPTAGEARFRSELVSMVEANLDDFPPQAISFAVERLFNAGALDVVVLPAVMKKGRSGHVLSIICKPEDRARMEELVLLETSSIGVRSYQAQRLIADREWQQVRLPGGGTVRIKIARDLKGQLMNAQPEYEDCVAYASAYNVPLKKVLNEALTEFWRQQEEQRTD